MYSVLLSHHPPERKDRFTDNNGGVIIYMKDNINHVSRADPEPIGVECVWIELTLRHKRIIFGLVYRPPSSDALYFSLIEDSMHSGIRDIITGDFNYIMLSTQSS